MRIFLDIGSHDGQTLAEVVKPKYGFDEIHGFEPMPREFAHLAPYGDVPRVTLHNYGLWDWTGTFLLYGTNDDMDASPYAAKTGVDATVQTECQCVAASEFFRGHVPDGATTIVKLNCEGAEVTILDDLIDSGEIWKIDHVVIDFDIRKVPGLESEEGRILERLAEIGFTRYADQSEVWIGKTHAKRIAHWLNGL